MILPQGKTKMKENRTDVKKIAFLGLMLALVIVLVWMERMLPPLPLLPPNMKLGLSNIVIMFSLFFVGKREGFLLVFLKALFNMLLRGPIGAMLSLSGGLLSVITIVLIAWLFKEKASYIMLGIVGAIAHNAGQLLIFCAIMQNFRLFVFYAPVLLVAGMILGILSGTLLKIALPTLQRIQMQLGGTQGRGT